MSKLNKILLLTNIFLLQSYLIHFKIGPYPTNLQEILITLQLFSFIYLTPLKKIFIALKKHSVILAFIILTGLSILLIPIENRLDFVRHFKFLVFSLILVFIFLKTLTNKKEKKAGLRIMGIGAIVFGVFSLIYNLLGYNQTNDQRLLGPLDAAVYLAYYLTPFFIFFAIEFFENPKRKSNLIYSVILGLLILATRSMGAIGSSLIILLIYFFKRNNLKFLRNTATKILLGIITIIVGTTIFYTKILPTFQTNYSSLDEREEIWQTSFELLKKPQNLILGVGFGQFQEKYFDNVEKVIGRKPLDFYVLQPHNIFLLFIFQYGILGLIFIIYYFHQIILNLLKSKKITLRTLSSFILLYFFIHGQIDTPFFKNDLLLILILFLELSLNQTTSVPKRRARSP